MEFELCLACYFLVFEAILLFPLVIANCCGCLGLHNMFVVRVSCEKFVHKLLDFMQHSMISVRVPLAMTGSACRIHNKNLSSKWFFDVNYFAQYLVDASESILRQHGDFIADNQGCAS